jgi:hypothetical protein
MWLLKTYGPDYSFYHPSYGLQHGARGEGDTLVLRGSLARAEQARADLAPICRGERDDPGARHLAAIACPPAPPRRPGAAPRRGGRRRARRPGRRAISLTSRRGRA